MLTDTPLSAAGGLQEAKLKFSLSQRCYITVKGFLKIRGQDP